MQPLNYPASCNLFKMQIWTLGLPASNTATTSYCAGESPIFSTPLPSCPPGVTLALCISQRALPNLPHTACLCTAPERSCCLSSLVRLANSHPGTMHSAPDAERPRVSFCPQPTTLSSKEVNCLCLQLHIIPLSPDNGRKQYTLHN